MHTDEKGKATVSESSNASSVINNNPSTSSTNKLHYRGNKAKERSKSLNDLIATTDFEAHPSTSTPTQRNEEFLRSSDEILKLANRTPLFYRTPVIIWFAFVAIIYILMFAVTFGEFESGTFYRKPKKPHLGLSAPDYTDEEVDAKLNAAREETQRFAGAMSIENASIAIVLLLSSGTIGAAQYFLSKKNYRTLRFLFKKKQHELYAMLIQLANTNKKRCNFPCTALLDPESGFETEHIIARFSKVIDKLAIKKEWEAIAWLLAACREQYGIYLPKQFREKDNDVEKSLSTKASAPQISEMHFESPNSPRQALSSSSTDESHTERRHGGIVDWDRNFVKHGYFYHKVRGKNLERYAAMQRQQTGLDKTVTQKALAAFTKTLEGEAENKNSSRKKNIGENISELTREDITRLLIVRTIRNIKSLESRKPENPKKLAIILKELLGDSEGVFDPTPTNLLDNCLLAMYFSGNYNPNLNDIDSNHTNKEAVTAFKLLSTAHQAKLIFTLQTSRAVTSELAWELVVTSNLTPKKYAAFFEAYITLAKSFFNKKENGVFDRPEQLEDQLIPLHVRLWLLTMQMVESTNGYSNEDGDPTKIKESDMSNAIIAYHFIELCEQVPQTAVMVLLEMIKGALKDLETYGNNPARVKDQASKQRIHDALAIMGHLESIFNKLDDKTIDNLLFKQPIENIKIFAKFLNFNTRFTLCRKKINYYIASKKDPDLKAQKIYAVYEKLISNLSNETGDKTISYIEFLTRLYQQPLDEKSRTRRSLEEIINLGIRGALLNLLSNTNSENPLLDIKLPEQIISLFEKDNSLIRAPAKNSTSDFNPASYNEPSTSAAPRISRQIVDNRSDIQALESADRITRSLVCEITNALSEAYKNKNFDQATHIEKMIQSFVIGFDDSSAFARFTYLINIIVGMTESILSEAEKYKLLFPFIEKYLCTNNLLGKRIRGEVVFTDTLLEKLDNHAHYLDLKKEAFDAITIFLKTIYYQFHAAIVQQSSSTKGSDSIANSLFSLIREVFHRNKITLENKHRDLLLSLLPKIQQIKGFSFQKNFYVPTIVMLINIFLINHRWKLSSTQTRDVYKFCKRFAEEFKPHSFNLINSSGFLPPAIKVWLMHPNTPASAAWGLIVIILISDALRPKDNHASHSTEHVTININKRFDQLMAATTIAYYLCPKRKKSDLFKANPMLPIWPEIRNLVEIVWDLKNPFNKDNTKLEIEECCEFLGLDKKIAQEIYSQLLLEKALQANLSITGTGISGKTELSPLLGAGSS